jgi:hypothetical protein
MSSTSKDRKAAAEPEDGRLPVCVEPAATSGPVPPALAAAKAGPDGVLAAPGSPPAVGPADAESGFERIVPDGPGSACAAGGGAGGRSPAADDTEAFAACCERGAGEPLAAEALLPLGACRRPARAGDEP